MKFFQKVREYESNALDKRVFEIDFFRGILILLVVFDHLMWFINFYLFHRTSAFLNWYWYGDLRRIVREIVLFTFLFLCGVSTYFSRNNKKRGLILLGLCVLITISTHLIQLLPMFDNRAIAIDFNILGVIALSILCFSVFEKLSSQNLLLITCGLIIFYVFLLISGGSSTYDPFRSIFGLSFNPVAEWYVGDYLPLFPYIIFLFLGNLCARYIYKEKSSKLPKLKGKGRNWIALLGRHTLIIYIVHEILFTLIFMLLDIIF